MTNPFIGRWQAVLRSEHGALASEDLFDYEFFADGEALQFRDRGRFVMVGDPPLVRMSPDGAAHATWNVIMPHPLSIEARVIENGAVLQATVKGLGTTGKGVATLRLERSPASLRAHFAPRLAANGSPATNYDYRLPHAINGGWPVAAPEDVGLDRRPLEDLARDILKEKDAPDAVRTDGVLVLRHGRLVFEEYFWGTRPELSHAISSITKSIASMLAGIAIDAGRLGLDDLVVDHFPDRADMRWRREAYPIRIHDLLAMNAGLRWTDKTAADQYSQKFLGSPDPIGFVLDLERAEAPGALYNYNNGLPSLLGPILARVMDEPLEVFADRTLFAPLGIRNYGWTPMPDGTPLLAGGMRMTPRDMAKIGQLMLDGGLWQGQRILSREWVTLSTTQQTRRNDYPYGYYWHLSYPDRPWTGDPPPYLGLIAGHHAFMGLGQGGQVILVLPDAGVVAVIISSNWKPRMEGAFPARLVNSYIVPAVR